MAKTNPRRHALLAAVCCLVAEHGAETADMAALETLTEALQEGFLVGMVEIFGESHSRGRVTTALLYGAKLHFSLLAWALMTSMLASPKAPQKNVLCEEQTAFVTLQPALLNQLLLRQTGRASCACAELAGRFEPLLDDVLLVLANMGMQLRDLEAHARRPGAYLPLRVPPSTAMPWTSAMLQTGVKQQLPSYMSTPHLPSFPDPHTYIRTPTPKQLITEPKVIREKSAEQRGGVVCALTRLVTQKSEMHNLFLCEDSNMFPLIACSNHFPVYLKALLPNDQVFHFEEESSSSPQKWKCCENKDNDDADDDDADADADDESNKDESDGIDNPYLKPVELPCLKKKSV